MYTAADGLSGSTFHMDLGCSGNSGDFLRQPCAGQPSHKLDLVAFTGVWAVTAVADERITQLSHRPSDRIRNVPDQCADGQGILCAPDAPAGGRRQWALYLLLLTPIFP
jgi:hypothetical protein